MADSDDEVEAFRDHLRTVQSEAYDLLKSAGYEDNALTDLKLSNWPSFPLPKVFWDGEREPKQLEQWALDYLGLYQLAKRWLRECASEEDRRKAYYLLKLGSDLQMAEFGLYSRDSSDARSSSDDTVDGAGGAKELARSLYDRLLEVQGEVSFKAMWRSLAEIGVDNVTPDTLREWLSEFRTHR